MKDFFDVDRPIVVRQTVAKADDVLPVGNLTEHVGIMVSEVD